MVFSADLSRVLEALLFVADEPVPLAALADAAGLMPAATREILADLADRYDRENRAWQLEEVAGGYRLATRPEYAPYIERLLRRPQPGLSGAALETLAIIAYQQPVTRLAIEQVRGVKADHCLATLLGKGLIKEVGRKETLGRPILYGTTEQFLRHFGLRSLKELPKIEDIFVQEELPLSLEGELANK